MYVGIVLDFAVAFCVPGEQDLAIFTNHRHSSIMEASTDA
jgi:hypothetical protein